MGTASRILLSLCLWLTSPALALTEAAPALADAAAPKPDASGASAHPDSADTKERRTLESFGTQNTKCAEWSDGCAVCTRDATGAPACSLPGIACQPAALACKSEAEARPPEPTPAEKAAPPEAPAAK